MYVAICLYSHVANCYKYLLGFADQQLVVTLTLSQVSYSQRLYMRQGYRPLRSKFLATYDFHGKLIILGSTE